VDKKRTRKLKKERRKMERKGRKDMLRRVWSGKRKS